MILAVICGCGEHLRPVYGVQYGTFRMEKFLNVQNGSMVCRQDSWRPVKRLIEQLTPYLKRKRSKARSNMKNSSAMGRWRREMQGRRM